MRAIDQACFKAIHGWPDSYEPLMRFFSEGIKAPPLRIAFLALILWMLFRGPRTRQTILLALLVVLVANGATELIKAFLPMDRPSVDFTRQLVRGGGLSSPGTASSHAANMAAVAAVFALRTRWTALLWIPVAVITGLSRIYMGVHYPSQVLFGWIVGALCGIVAVKRWEAYAERRTGGEESQEASDEPDSTT